MKNLADLKRRLADTLKNGGTVDFTYKDTTTYKNPHPNAVIYPDGTTLERKEEGTKIGTVQSNAFTRITHKGTESWLFFGSAKKWEFPDKDTAVLRVSESFPEWSSEQTLTYKFNQ